MHGGCHDQRQPASDGVTPRPDEQLPEGEPEGGGGQCQLHDRCRDIQIGFDDGESREVEVDGERAERRQRAEHEHVHQALAWQQRVTGVNYDGHA